ncbi:MAG: D-3-phosphoglycerate dehydrogenase, partial [Verrucomicrobia bacterium]|nr:D-3-phosphoglycerate dehydrogenase [Verrucomicrobiota bacterium]
MPLTDATQYLIDEAALAKCKKGVRLFNCARGGIIKESALIAALKSGQVGAAGLDVYEEEPLAKDSEFRSLPNVVLTPHLGASTAEAQDAVGLEIAEQITDVLAGGIIRNAVNMPSIDAAMLKILGPYLDLGQKLGTLVQQIAPQQVETIRITYWGKMIDLDVNAVTRSIQRGWLRRISGESVNFVNAPVALQRLGVKVDVIKSTDDIDYAELIGVEAIAADGSAHAAKGTLLGKTAKPRLVEIYGREVEAEAHGKLLIIENHDEPGMIGYVGTLLGRDKVNIANMSLSRQKAGETALMVINLDSEPSPAARQELKSHRAIKLAKFVQL